MRYHAYLVKQWNLGILRARLDYERHPSRACLVRTCFELHDDDYKLCRFHRRERKRKTAYYARVAAS